MALFRHVYISTATVLFSKEQLLSLLEGARRRNSAAGVTGLLLYRDGAFMQCMEGEEAAVKATINRIARDDRHKGRIPILGETISERTFGDWAMAFRDLNSPELHEISGYSKFLNDEWFGRKTELSPDRALRLLQGFRSTMR